MENIVMLHGYVHKIRRMSGFAFVILRMQGELTQCVWSPETASFALEELPEGACVRLTGRRVREPRARDGYETHLLGVEVLSVPVEEAPVVINQKEIMASLDSLLTHRPLTLRHPKQRAVFALQEAIVRGFEETLRGEGFHRVHTPKLGAAGAEGGANLFKVPYFGSEATLAQSPQLYKQMLVGVFERVYEVGPAFRAEAHDTARHLSEFVSLDLEMGFIQSMEDIMRLEERLIFQMLGEMRETCHQELALLETELPVLGDVPRIRFHEAKEQLRKEGVPVEEDDDLSPAEEKGLGQIIKERAGSDFVFVTHYPSAKRPFYTMDDPENPDVTLSFDLLCRGAEVTTGGQRIHHYHAQTEKMRSRGIDPGQFSHYLMAHKQALPPHGGLGMGLERLTMQMLGLPNIRNACLFPRDRNRLTP